MKCHSQIKYRQKVTFVFALDVNSIKGIPMFLLIWESKYKPNKERIGAAFVYFPSYSYLAIHACIIDDSCLYPAPLLVDRSLIRNY